MKVRASCHTLPHNCSGKHTGMLAHAKLRGAPLENYIDFHHPFRKVFLRLLPDVRPANRQVELGIDGCSAPNFAVPLYNAAFGYARLCDPFDQSPARAAACKTITSAMLANPDMVGGPDVSTLL